MKIGEEVSFPLYPVHRKCPERLSVYPLSQFASTWVCWAQNSASPWSIPAPCRLLAPALVKRLMEEYFLFACWEASEWKNMTLSLWGSFEVIGLKWSCSQPNVCLHKAGENISLLWNGDSLLFIVYCSFWVQYIHKILRNRVSGGISMLNNEWNMTGCDVKMPDAKQSHR